MTLQVNSKHYKFSDYVDKNRWMSFYHQLRIIDKYNPKSILEIGPGNKFLGKLIGDRIKYVSLDIDRELNPEVQGSILKLPFKNNSFDTICCFQVLEHFPFEQFTHILNQLIDITKKYIFISLPFANHKFSFEFHVPVINEIQMIGLIPRFYKQHKFDGQHYWEVGTKGYGRKAIRNLLKNNYRLLEEFVPKENTNHIFYILEKNR